MHIIQKRWEKRQCLILSGLIFGDGQIVRFEIPKTSVCELIVIERLDIETAIVKFGDYWTNLIPTCEVHCQEDDLLIEAGEGSYGSEGYVAVSRISDGNLVWLAYFDYSNPFYDLSIDEEKAIVAKTTHNDIWRFNLDKPHQIEFFGDPFNF